MNRARFGLAMVAGAALAVAPQATDAQLNVQVGLYWELGDDGWRAYRPTYAPARYDEYYADDYYERPREVVYYTPQRSVRVPPGHMPRRGFCRLWYPGRPPGHQPRARPCEQLFRMRHYDGAVILGAADYRPDYRVVRWEYDDDDRGKRGNNGRGRGRGRGGE